MRKLHKGKRKDFKSPVYMFGVRVPNTPQEARYLDKKNNQTKWKGSEDAEIDQLWEYDTFIDLGKGLLYQKDTLSYLTG